MVAPGTPAVVGSPPPTRDYAELRGEGSIPVSLPPPARFGISYLEGAKGPKSREFCLCFCSGESSGRLQLLSIGSGERIFLQNLRTNSGSLILNLPGAEASSGRCISNPSPSTEIGKSRFDPFRPSHALSRPKIVVNFYAKSLHFAAIFAHRNGL